MLCDTADRKADFIKSTHKKQGSHEACDKFLVSKM